MGTLEPIPRREVGTTGIHVSTIALGTWLTIGERLTLKEADGLVQTAFDQGVNLIDTAHSYSGAERTLGRILRGIDRSKFLIMTKCFFNRTDRPLPDGEGLTPANLRYAIETSLSETRLDTIDFYLCHRFDADTPISSVVRTMGSLVVEGKIRAWGVGRWTVPQIREAIAEARCQGVSEPCVTQDFYNLFNPRAEADLLPFCDEEKFGFVGYSPLARGVLTGKYIDGIPKDSRAADAALSKTLFDLNREKLATVNELRSIARSWGMTTAQAVLATTLAKEGYTSAIVGARTPQQLVENIQSARVTLTSADRQRVRRLFDAVIARDA